MNICNIYENVYIFDSKIDVDGSSNAKINSKSPLLLF